MQKKRAVLRLDEYAPPMRLEQLVGNLAAGRGKSTLTVDLARFRECGFGASTLFGASLQRRAGDACIVKIGPARNESEYWIDLMSSGMLHLAAPFARIRSSVGSQEPYILSSDPLNRDFVVRGVAKVIPNLQSRRAYLAYDAYETETETEEWLKQLALDTTTNTEKIRGELANLIWEAIWNVIEHAASPPHTEPQNVRGIASLRRFEIEKLLGRLGPEPDQITEYWRTFLQDSQEAACQEILQVVVSDNGNGIARRHGGWSNTTGFTVADEREKVRHALIRGQTSKTTADLQGATRVPGFGLNNLSKALENVNGACSIRTGRIGCLARSDTEGQFQVLDGEFSDAVGTTLCLAIPLHRPIGGVFRLGRQDLS
jgi:hypothetical protein